MSDYVRKPEYQFVRYDIRPDIMGNAFESELVSLFESIQADKNVEWIAWAFEVVHNPDGSSRPFSKHCHVCIKYKKARRTDRTGFPAGTLRVKHQLPPCAIKFSGRRWWSDRDKWMAGYVQKDGEWHGNAPDMSDEWWSHAKELKRPTKRRFEITKNNVINCIESVYYEHHEDIESKARAYCNCMGADVYDVCTYMALVLGYDMKCWRLNERLRIFGYGVEDWVMAKEILRGFTPLGVTDGFLRNKLSRKKQKTEDMGGLFLEDPQAAPPEAAAEDQPEADPDL